VGAKGVIGAGTAGEQGPRPLCPHRYQPECAQDRMRSCGCSDSRKALRLTDWQAGSGMRCVQAFGVSHTGQDPQLLQDRWARAHARGNQQEDPDTEQALTTLSAAHATHTRGLTAARLVAAFYILPHTPCCYPPVTAVTPPTTPHPQCQLVATFYIHGAAIISYSLLIALTGRLLIPSCLTADSYQLLLALTPPPHFPTYISTYSHSCLLLFLLSLRHIWNPPHTRKESSKSEFEQGRAMSLSLQAGSTSSLLESCSAAGLGFRD